ncbi:MAG: hypothetical protein M3256_07740, partial [Actinomycetota bacterium]|nr:hypothetical protein [Actinomycetota bacterium]
MSIGAALGAVALIGAVLGFNDLRRIRSELTKAQATLQQSINDPGALQTPQGRAATIAAVTAAQSSIQVAADRATGSLALRAAGLLPGLR